MDAAIVTFYMFCGLAVVAATGMVFTKNLLYAAGLLAIVMLSLAVVFIYAGAMFLAVSQILIYVGGILVLIIFGVMLTSRKPGFSFEAGTHYHFFGWLAGLSIMVILIMTILDFDFTRWMHPPEVPDNLSGYTSIQHIGVLLMSKYLLILELAAIFLLVVMAGALQIGAKEEGGKAS